MTYLDLDRLIETCGLTKGQKQVVDLLMDGYTESDIADMAGCARDRVAQVFQMAIEKITARENFLWRKASHFSVFV